ncbi:undecaprenyl-diphosphatase [Thermodesulfitimonas autotrophica]|uniref:Undecaprenyl-diphosphatase n=1 Tax=Thermodesulfitimonas autotrophica TaxID=1894989 RepID=A0A3N5BFV4_9THEO|nr:undecaprenyl-diphosphatase UppP [Thermodesulfitimonas autotrophica]RPF46962.1 undecaprenyl-diphosphatase [Thermodesulfitimonas autotrophica]
MSITEAVVLGIVQGLGEFLPISSSAHLVLTPWFFGWPDPGLSFDVALHLGTLVAVVAYFWRDWLTLATHGLRGTRSREGRLFWYLVVATVPGGLAGMALEKYAETTFRAPGLVGLMLIFMGLILYWADHRGPRARGIWQVGWGDAFLIGFAQALAIVPGVSRSGATIAAGRFLGLDREAATRFSFLLSLPIILGAGLFSLRHIGAQDLTFPFWVGVVTSGITGFAAIAFLLRFVVTRNFNVFVWYRGILGLLTIVTALSR